ncbi:MAG: preprotein translocase subunit SecG [Salibacteraceae bacterium]|jgi:preprotein translocase subunit SecG
MSFITVLIIIVGILLGLVVLIQNPKGGGLASGFSGANQFGGVQRTNDFLDKSTWTLVIVLFALSVLSSSMTSTVNTVDDAGSSELQELVEDEQGVTAPAPVQ